MDPYGDIFSSTPHIVYSTGYSWMGGNSKFVPHAVMTGWGEWEQRTVPGASVSGVGLALDRDQYPLIIHGDGNNGQWGDDRGVQIYITGWDLDGDGLPSWKDECPWIYGLSTDDKPGCQDLDGDGESELNDVSEQADDTPAIGVLGATIIMVVVATILRPKRREDDGNLVKHGIEVD